MEWENKVEMVKLGNSGDNKGLQHFVLDHINTFDNQAFDMLFNMIEIIPSEIRKDIQFYKKLYPKLIALDLNNFGLRSSMRLSSLIIICEAILNLNKDKDE